MKQRTQALFSFGIALALSLNAAIYMFGKAGDATAALFLSDPWLYLKVMGSATAMGVFILFLSWMFIDPMQKTQLASTTAPDQGASDSRRAFVLGTGAAYGEHYTTEQMIAAFKAQRIAEGDDQCDFDFAERVFKKCGFDGHSVALEGPRNADGSHPDLFRRMKRSEYLKRRRSKMVDLAEQAANKALEQWGGKRSDVTHLLWGTMTGGIDSPEIDIQLSKRLGLNFDVERLCVGGMGCLTGYRLLNVGRQSLGNEHARTGVVLCVAADLRSALGNSLPDKVSRSDMVSAALFRDCASAAVLGTTHYLPRLEQHLLSGQPPLLANPSDKGMCHYEVVCGKSYIIPDTNELVKYNELDGGAIKLFLDRFLPDAMAKSEPVFVKALLELGASVIGSQTAPLTVQDADFAVHTGGPSVLRKVGHSIGASEEQLASSWAVMRAHGNLSGASNLAVLDHYLRGQQDEKAAAPSTKDWLVGLSCGPGACLEGVVLHRHRYS